jgi:hypothetical protein
MNVSLALLADYANVSLEGKLNVLGIFDVIHVHSLPGGVPQFYLVVRLSATAEEKASRHRVEFSLIDPDRNSLVNMQAEVEVPDTGAPGPVRIELVISLPVVQFHQYGPHEVEFLIDGAPAGSIPLTVWPPQAPPEEAAGG